MSLLKSDIDNDKVKPHAFYLKCVYLLCDKPVSLSGKSLGNFVRLFNNAMFSVRDTLSQRTIKLAIYFVFKTRCLEVDEEIKPDKLPIAKYGAIWGVKVGFDYFYAWKKENNLGTISVDYFTEYLEKYGLKVDDELDEFLKDMYD